MIEKYTNFNIKDTLFSWIYGIIKEDFPNKSFTSIEHLINNIAEKNTTSIKSSLTIDNEEYVFEMKLTKKQKTGIIAELLEKEHNCKYTGECDYKVE